MKHARKMKSDKGIAVENLTEIEVGSLQVKKSSPLEGCEVVIILPHLGPGGAQRVATLVLNQWSRQGMNVGLITTLDNKPDAHKLDAGVKRLYLSKLTIIVKNKPKSEFRFITILIRKLVQNFHKMLSGIYIFVDANKKKFNIIHFPIRVLINLYAFIRKIFKLIAIYSYKYIIFKNIKLRLSRVLLGFREQKLRQLLEVAPPPRILSFLTKTNILTTLATWDLPSKVIISERNDPDKQHLEPLWEELRLFAYKRADLATSNSEGVLTKMKRFTGKVPLELLPNPLELPPSLKQGAVRKPRFIIVARLVHQKAVDIMLAAFALIADKIPEWKIDIVGEGPLRAELETYSRKINLQKRIIFHGHVTIPMDLLLSASVFVLPSRFEGMPNSLLEAMASGLPSIVTDSSPGPMELVQDEHTGLVVPVEDVNALATAMLRLAKDEATRKKFGEAAQKFVHKYDWSNVEMIWRKVLMLPVLQTPPMP